MKGMGISCGEIKNDRSINLDHEQHFMIQNAQPTNSLPFETQKKLNLFFFQFYFNYQNLEHTLINK